MILWNLLYGKLSHNGLLLRPSKSIQNVLRVPIDINQEKWNNLIFKKLRTGSSLTTCGDLSLLLSNIQINRFHPSNHSPYGINSSITSKITPSHLSLTLNQTQLQPSAESIAASICIQDILFIVFLCVANVIQQRMQSSGVSVWRLLGGRTDELSALVGCRVLLSAQLSTGATWASFLACWSFSKAQRKEPGVCRAS
jgi:hypothetical protein